MAGSFGQGTGPILLHQVFCLSTEAQLLNCPNRSSTLGLCGHNEDVGVTCLSKYEMTVFQQVSYVCIQLAYCINILGESSSPVQQKLFVHHRFSLIASTSAAASQLRPLQLLLLDCIPEYVRLWSCPASTKYNKYKGCACVTSLVPPPKCSTSITQAHTTHTHN